MNSFVPLHINSVYTLLDSALTIKDIINIAKKNNLNCIALTDFASLSGSIEFCSISKQQNIKPIVGIDLKIDDIFITFLIKNEIGYKNIIQLFSLYNANNLSIEKCANYKDGLIAIVSTYQSKLLKKINLNNKINILLQKMSQIFSIDFFIGLEIYNNIEPLEIKNMREFIKNNNFQPLAFPLTKYDQQENLINYSLITAIKENKTFDIEELKKQNNSFYHFYNESEIKKKYTSEEIYNTKKIADAITFDIIANIKHNIKNDNGNNNKEYFKEIVFKCLKQKIKNLNDSYIQRINYETEIISRSNYINYFLIVADYVQFAKKNNIYIGPGRGSAGGSLVAYALDIITIDPIKYNLLFERFLNENRKNAPDIDIDIENERRQDILEYLKEKYGKNNVAHISVIQTIKAKQALNLIKKILKIKDYYINNLIKNLDNYDDLHEAYKKNTLFKQLINSDKYYLFIVKMASKIEHIPIKFTIHASGIIINSQKTNNLNEILPTYINDNGDIVTCFTNNILEFLGFNKMDILSLYNLGIIKKIINNINENEKIKINFYDLPFEDQKTIQIIANGYTAGIFQLESKKNIIKSIGAKNINNFNDIVLLISLYRPGSIKFIKDFIIRKSQSKNINYPSNKIVNVLKPTYGIIIFQEQIIQIISIMTGCNFNESDIFRRNLTNKKNINELQKFFIKKSIANGNSITDSKKTFELLEKYANFNFNKSHAVAYAKLICQMAFLKANYPLFFYTTFLNLNEQNEIIFNEIQKQDITIEMPDINNISDKFKIKNDHILTSIFIINISKQNAVFILKERNENGPFSNFLSFVTRTIQYKIPLKEIENLINCGLFDCFNANRDELRKSLKNVFSFANLTKNLKSNNYNLLIPKPKIEKTLNINFKEEIINEYNSTGIILTPILKKKYQEMFLSEKAVYIQDIKKNIICNIICCLKKHLNINKKMLLTINDMHNDVLNIYVEQDTIDVDNLYNKLILISCRFNFQKKHFITDKIKIL